MVKVLEACINPDLMCLEVVILSQLTACMHATKLIRLVHMTVQLQRMSCPAYSCNNCFGTAIRSQQNLFEQKPSYRTPTVAWFSDQPIVQLQWNEHDYDIPAHDAIPSTNVVMWWVWWCNEIWLELPTFQQRKQTVWTCESWQAPLLLRTRLRLYLRLEVEGRGSELWGHKLLLSHWSPYKS